jgi:sporulation protein YlmC with PRC-barrel domain
MDTDNKDNLTATLEQENMTGENRSGKNPNKPVKYLTASTVIGDKVYNNLNESLGDIKDIMLNLVDGTIEYVVIEFGGFLGMGDKYFAVPFKALSIDTSRHAFVLGQRREVLENAPGFDKDHWPETNDHTMRTSSQYWGSFMGPNTGAEPF